MEVRITWHHGGWAVHFGSKGHVLLETFSYQKAFFWKKYAADLDSAFILDYIEGR
jgi:hypothetical protein